MLTKKQRKAIKNKLAGRHVLSSQLQRVKNRYPYDSKKILEMRAEHKDMEVPAFSSYGSYPIFYLIKDAESGDRGGLDVACADCVNNRKYLGSTDGAFDYDANWEDPDMYCSACNERIESAYAEDEVGKSVEE